MSAEEETISDRGKKNDIVQIQLNGKKEMYEITQQRNLKKQTKWKSKFIKFSTPKPRIQRVEVIKGIA